MEYQIEFSYPPRFLSRTAKTVWLQNYGTTYFYFIGVPLLAFALCFTSSEMTSSRAGSIFTGFLLGVTATVGFQFLYQFLSYEKGASVATQQWNNVKVTYTFDDEGISQQSKLGSGHYTWKVVTKVAQTPKAWMLVFGDQDYVAFPTEVLSDELKQFITRKSIEARAESVQ